MLAAVRSRPYDAMAGAVAAAIALAVGELVASFDAAGTSLVSAVGDSFIDRFAAALKDLAVRWFGTNDKVALVVGIVVVALAIGAALGVATRRRPWVGPAGLAAFGVVGFLAYRNAALADAFVGALAATAATVAGIIALRLLLRRVPDGTDGVEAAPPAAAQPMTGATRRRFLRDVGLLGAGAAGTAALGRRLRGSDPSAEVREALTVPPPMSRVPVPATGTIDDVPRLTPYVTPVNDFYRIDTALSIPRIDPDGWSLTIDGLVDRPFSVGYDELLAMDAVEVPVTLQCVSNEVGGDLIGNAVWQGVPLPALLDRAGVQAEGDQILGRSVDGFTAGFPTELALDGRTALVAYAMNGELLPTRHGFPARLVVAGLYGYVSATKWLSSIELTRRDDVDGYWVPRGWSKDAPIKITSRVDVPRTRAVVGPVAVGGVASAPTLGISAVEVQIDDGPWQRATLGTSASDETWVQWHLLWDATPGRHRFTVRAFDGDGRAQVEQVAPPAPDGATGLHSRVVHVEPA